MGIYDKSLLRPTIEGIFYWLRMEYLWRDLPASFGKWNAIYKRFNEGSCKETLINIFNTLVVEPDLEWAFINASIVKAHQHSSGEVHDGKKVPTLVAELPKVDYILLLTVSNDDID